jgi:hypothetical protein
VDDDLGIQAVGNGKEVKQMPNLSGLERAIAKSSAKRSIPRGPRHASSKHYSQQPTPPVTPHGSMDNFGFTGGPRSSAPESFYSSPNSSLESVLSDSSKAVKMPSTPPPQGLKTTKEYQRAIAQQPTPPATPGGSMDNLGFTGGPRSSTPESFYSSPNSSRDLVLSDSSKASNMPLNPRLKGPRARVSNKPSFQQPTPPMTPRGSVDDLSFTGTPHSSTPKNFYSSPNSLHSMDSQPPLPPKPEAWQEYNAKFAESDKIYKQAYELPSPPPLPPKPTDYQLGNGEHFTEASFNQKLDSNSCALSSSLIGLSKTPEGRNFINKIDIAKRSDGDYSVKFPGQKDPVHVSAEELDKSTFNTASPHLQALERAYEKTKQRDIERTVQETGMSAKDLELDKGMETPDEVLRRIYGDKNVKRLSSNETTEPHSPGVNVPFVTRGQHWLAAEDTGAGFKSTNPMYTKQLDNNAYHPTYTLQPDGKLLDNRRQSIADLQYLRLSDNY